MVAIALLVALPSIGATLIADRAFPHGPEIFVGYIELCDDRLGCNEVPNYVEDTSGLNNPGWVDFFRDNGDIFYVLAILLAFVVLIQGLTVWKWWRPRYGLIWPHRPDEWVRKIQWLRSTMEWDFEVSDELEHHFVEFRADMDKRIPTATEEWQYWDAAGRLLYGFRHYDDAVWALETAKSWDELPEGHIFQGKEAEYRENRLRHQKIIDDWHDVNIEHIEANKR